MSLGKQGSKLKNNQQFPMTLLQRLLMPLAVLYNAGTKFRNHLYDIGNRKSFSFDVGVISVGNLSAGGSGKTPMVEYLVTLLANKYPLCTLSRGYKRKTKGFKMANADDNALSIGDEPFQFYTKFNTIASIAVGEERALAIPEILFEKPETKVIILDDAFQHRSVVPDLSILVTEYGRPFFEDYLLPSGRLREARKQAKRADIIVVSKCPENISKETWQYFLNEISRYARQDVSVFFTFLQYGNPVHWYTGETVDLQNALAFTGIGNPLPFYQYLERNQVLVDKKEFPDHYIFSETDILSIKKAFDSINLEAKCMLTTEKDIMRIKSLPFSKKMQEWPLYYVPVKIAFVENAELFDIKVQEVIIRKLEELNIKTEDC